MIWQNLKNKAGACVGYLDTVIGRFIAWLQVPLNKFRFVAVLLALDFVAFMSLTKSSYLQLLNPMAFLTSVRGESRMQMQLYFPRSLSLTGIEKIYAEDDGVSKANGESGKATLADKDAPSSRDEKVVDTAQLSAEVILIQKRVSAPQTKQGVRELSSAEATARRVVYELIAGPAGETESLKARPLIKERQFLRALWTYQDTLYISTEKTAWDKMTPNERKITEFCILESLKKNLPTQKLALLRE